MCSFFSLLIGTCFFLCSTLIEGSFKLTFCNVIFISDSAIITIIAISCFSVILLIFDYFIVSVLHVHLASYGILSQSWSTCLTCFYLSSFGRSINSLIISFRSLHRCCSPPGLTSCYTRSSTIATIIFVFVVVSYIEIICLFSFYSISFYLVSFCCSFNSLIISLIKRILLRCYSSWPISCFGPPGM